MKSVAGDGRRVCVPVSTGIQDVGPEIRLEARDKKLLLIFPADRNSQ